MDETEFAMVTAAQDVRRVGTTLAELVPTTASRDDELGADVRAVIDLLVETASKLEGIGSSWHYTGD